MVATLKTQTIPSKPERGQAYLSLNLEKVSQEEAQQAAKTLGFTGATKVLLNYPSGLEESHLLLWSGAIASAPAELEAQFAQLADRFEGDAIRYVLGRRPTVT